MWWSSPPSFRLLKTWRMNSTCLVCFSGLFLLSVLNYTDLNWDVPAVSVRAEKSVTQTRLTAHHITLKGPDCRFNPNHILAFFTLLWSVFQSTASVFSLISFFFPGNCWFQFMSEQHVTQISDVQSVLELTNKETKTQISSVSEELYLKMYGLLGKMISSKVK